MKSSPGAMKCDEQRKEFEQWISAKERSADRTDRWPDDDGAWPGQYCYKDVQLAWEAWCGAMSSVEPLVKALGDTLSAARSLEMGVEETCAVFDAADKALRAWRGR